MKRLTRAVIDDNHQEVRRLLQYYCYQKRADLHEFYREIGMLLHMTVNITTATILLKHGAVINVKNKIRETPLFTAARNCESPIEYMEYLITNGADVNAENNMEETPLHCAIIAQNYKVDIIRMLVRNGANINALNIEGESPLHIVAKNRYLKIYPIDSLTEVLKHKILDNLFSEPNGESSLYHSFDEFDSPATIVKELIENGANPNIVNRFGKSVLHLALENEDVDADVVFELIKNEANTKLVTLIEGYAPLHIAVKNMNSKLSIVKAILETNVQVDPLDKKKNTPLHLAVGNHNTNFDIIKQLLNSGANINAKNYFLNTPLHISVKTKPSVMKELLKWSPEIDTRNFDGDTPLTVASRYYSTCPHIVKCLLKAGADPNCANFINNTPLQLAVENCDITIDVVKEALITGVLDSMKTASNNVRAYLDLAKKDTNSIKKCLDRIRTVNPPSVEDSQRNKLLVIEYLLAYGAQINYKAIHGLSPLDIAIKKLENKVDNGSCAKLLIKYAVLKNFVNNSYKKIVDLNGYKSYDCYKELANYFESCITEVKRMKKDRVKSSLSLYEYLTKGINCAVMEDSGSDEEGCGSIEDDNQIVDLLITSILKNKYPIYGEIMIRKIKKSTYLSKMMDHCIYCYVEDKESEGKKKKVSLDPDATLSVMKYLNRSDLLNLTLAYFYNIGEAILPEPPKRWSLRKRTRSTAVPIGSKVAKIAKFGMDADDFIL